MKDNKVVEVLVHEVTNLGGAVTYFFIAIMLFFMGLYPVAYSLVVGIILSLIIIIILRLSFFRPRPKKEKYKGIIEKIAAGTFPSHHSANIGLMTMIFTVTFSSIFLTTFMVLVSAGVLFSRVYLKRHYWLDVSAGYAIGMVIGYII